jgi:hypothetical protein
VTHHRNQAFDSNIFRQRRIPISTIHALGTASVILLLDATSQDTKPSNNAIRLLKFNMTCLQEMSVAWNWSLRAIRSLQILAEEWSVNEKLHAQNTRTARDAPSVQNTATDADIGGLGSVDIGAPGNETVFPDGASSTMLETSPENIDWLLAFDSGFADAKMDFAYFDPDLWEMGA